MKGVISATILSSSFVVVALAIGAVALSIGAVVSPDAVVGPEKIGFDLQPVSAAPVSLEELVSRTARLGCAEDVYALAHGGPPTLVVAGRRCANEDLQRVIADAGYGITQRTLGRMQGTRGLYHMFATRLTFLPIWIMFQAVGLILVGWYGYRRFRNRDPRESVPLRRRVIAGIGLGVICSVVTSLIGLALQALGIPTPNQSWELALAGDWIRVLAWSPALVILGPLAEEIFFRGFLVSLYREKAGAAAGWFFPAIWFAVIHFNPLAFPIYALLGAAFAFGFVRSGGLLVPVLAHAVYNAIAVVGLALS